MGCKENLTSKGKFAQSLGSPGPIWTTHGIRHPARNDLGLKYFIYDSCRRQATMFIYIQPTVFSFTPNQHQPASSTFPSIFFYDLQ